MREFYTEPMALRIKHLRMKAGLSQQMLAEKAGISRSQLSEIEGEKKPANTIRLNSIASALGVPVNDLFDAAAKDTYCAEMLALMATMDEDDQKALLRMASALASRQ